MLIFWIFGILLIFFLKPFDIFKDHIYISNYLLQKAEYTMIIIMGLSLFVAYQILFICILAPFMLISFFYHKFFDRIALFFEV